MRFNRIESFALCLGVALLLMTGSAMAGTATADDVTYAREQAYPGRTYTIPAGNTIVHDMGVIRNSSQDFFVDLSLSSGAFAGGLATDDLTLTVIPAGGYVVSIIGPSTGSTVRFYVNVTVDPGPQPPTVTESVTFDTSGWLVTDTSDVLGGGGSISATVVTKDSATNIEFDPVGDNTDEWLLSKNVLADVDLTATSATIDVNTMRVHFVAGINGGDTTVQDNGAQLGILGSSSTIYGANGTLYTLAGSSMVRVFITGDLSGVTNITWNGVGYYSLNGSQAEIRVYGGNPILDGNLEDIQITVDGETALAARILKISVYLDIEESPSPYDDLYDRYILGETVLTTWSPNGTILLTNWTNGNWAALNGRIYLWNPSSVDGEVTLRVFTLPLGFGGSTLVGTLEAGLLKSESGVNLRVGEDILVPLGITTPYTTNGGNLVIEVTIAAPGCNGYSQVFSSGFAYGTVQLQRIN
jgi:hypothetical protein